MGGVVTGVRLVLEQPDVLQRQTQEEHERRQPTSQSQAQGAKSRTPCPGLAPEQDHGPRPHVAPRSRVTRRHAQDRSPADLQHLVGVWPRSLTLATQLDGYTLFLEETAEPTGQQRAGKAAARLSTNRALGEWGAH